MRTNNLSTCHCLAIIISKINNRHHYDTIQIPSKWLLANDDDIANIRNVHDMLSVFPNMDSEIEALEPKALNVNEIGHMKFFSRKCQHLWPKVTDYFKRYM
ncbi:hypothetical protein ACI7YQ_02000 [Alteromonas marina]|uniref:hypothetical protein n=1 Tax=unclassified Alteromonas TaxID=2614992 RepID=UPI0012E4BA93|nr:hypothetical protein [Alteromonas sp. KUL150]GFD74829.1 hypothetical protein KUL113_42490 [Tenacibaculum sp. KUL113]GFD86627.1 hypothetical protein KUL150_26860 [Alteromonas sp. KUL150]